MTTPTWRNGWRIVLTRETMNDYFNTRLPVSRFHQNTYREFDTDTTVFYPIGIAQLVALKRWIWFKSYVSIKKLGETQCHYELAIRRKGIEQGRQQERAQIKQELAAEYKRGRDFEFRTINSHLEAMYRAAARDDTKTMLGIFKETLRLMHDRDS